MIIFSTLLYKVLKVVLPNEFSALFHKMNDQGRKVVKLLREKEFDVSDEAMKLFELIDPSDLAFLYRILKRA